MIEMVPVNGSDRPITDVVMDSVRVTQFPLGISPAPEAELKAFVFPNPINNQSALHLEMAQSEQVQIQLIGMNGNVLFSQDKRFTKGAHDWSLENLNLSKMSPGLYVISVNSETYSAQFKVTK